MCQYNQKKNNHWPCNPEIWSMAILIIMLLTSGVLSAARVEVTKCTVGADNNGRYDRNPSFVNYGGEGWLFYTKGDNGSTAGVRNIDYNPDNDSYVIWYKKITLPDDITNAPEIRLDLSETARPIGFDQRDVSAVVFNGILYVFASAGFGGSQQPVYYYRWDGAWTGPISLGTPGGGHCNAVCDADRVYLAMETGVDATLKSVAYTWDGTTLNGPYTVADGNGVPKITLKDGNLYVVSIAPGAQSINLHSAMAIADPSTWTYLSNPIMVIGAYVWDPSIFVSNNMLHVLAAPSTAVPDQQWIVQTRSSDNGLTWSPVRKISTGGNGSVYWWEYWPVGYANGKAGEGFIFFTTEGKDGSYGDGMIGGIGIDWSLDNEHSFYIQPAIDMASNGDTVAVGNDTFTGDGNRDIDLLGKSVLLEGSSGTDTTTIDCRGSILAPHRAFYVHRGEDTNSVISNFNIINACDTLGAVRCSTSAPIFRNCAINGNQCNGFYASNGSNPRLYDCAISNNIGSGAVVENSSHLYDYNWSTLTMKGGVVARNRNKGISVEQATGIIDRTDVLNNDSAGVMVLWNAPVELKNSLIKGNGKEGIFIVQSGMSNFKISNCTVISNKLGIFIDFAPPKEDISSYRVMPADSPFIANSIFAYNQNEGIKHGLDPEAYRLACNNSFGNPAGNYVQTTPYAPGDSYGNISLNPFFCDTLINNYYIANISPCAPPYNSYHTLIGKYDVGCTMTFMCGDANGSGVVNALDITFLINCLYKGGVSPNPWQSGDVNSSGNINALDVTYLINFLYKHGPTPKCL